MWTLPWGERENIWMFWAGNWYDWMYVLETSHWGIDNELEWMREVQVCWKYLVMIQVKCGLIQCSDCENGRRWTKLENHSGDGNCQDPWEEGNKHEWAKKSNGNNGI